MSGGPGKLRPDDNTNGFQVNPQNINKNGRPPSIRKQIRELLKQTGVIRIPIEQIATKHKDGSVTIKVPNDLKIAMKLEQWAMSGKERASLGAIKIMVEQTDGAPEQTQVIIDPGLDLSLLTLAERKQYLSLVRKATPIEETDVDTDAK